MFGGLGDSLDFECRMVEGRHDEPCFSLAISLF